MTSQKEAVYGAVMSVCKEHNVTPTKGQPYSEVMTREMRAQVNAILVTGFKSGKIPLETQFPNDSALKAYVSGLQSNWLRKDTRLNGGESYKPAAPGSRSGQQDPAIREMRKLLEHVTSKKDREEIQACIDERLANLKKVASKPAVDITVLPSRLHKYAVAS